MIAMKFGGTSVQDATAMNRVAQIVSSRRPEQPVVIISAIAQATNVLERAGKLASEGHPDEARSVLLTLIDRHFAIIDALIADQQRKIGLRDSIAQALAALEELVKGVAILRELTPRTLDAFYCYGELLSSRIVAAVLNEQGIPAVWLDTKEFMITDESYGRAVPRMQLVESRLQAIALPHLELGKVPVTQGFIGATESGIRTTMGRESSDYSSSIIGVALNVREIQIWTDVDGVLTADPRVVASPHRVQTLSFEEAFELSYFGAKVLHPNTMLPAMEKNIPIRIVNSQNPGFEGTVVAASSPNERTEVKSVAFKRSIIVISVAPHRRLSQYMFWEQLYNVLTKHAAVASMTSTSEYSVSLALDAKHHHNALLADLQNIGRTEVMPAKAIVCVVGREIRDASDVINRIFQALAGVRIGMVSFGASRNNLSLVVDESNAEDAVRSIHGEFFTDHANVRPTDPLARIVQPLGSHKAI